MKSGVGISAPATVLAILGASLCPCFGEVSFRGDVLPILEDYCISCHDAEINEGEIDFELFFSDWEAEKQPDLWEKVAALVEMEQMPPRDKPNQPAAGEREILISWSRQLGEKWDLGLMGRDPGRTTIRRLNKHEFNYTIRDLFGLSIRPANGFPEDGGGEAGFDNNADALFLPTLLMENYVEAARTIVDTVYKYPASRSRYLFVRPDKETKPAAAARQVLRFWASRAYRRHVGDAELNRLVGIFQRELSRKKNFNAAMRAPLLAILLSPNFLYRAEQELDTEKPFEVDTFDLASRLSYFLWSSMPDQELFRLAADGTLNQPAVIRAQVIRMLQDDRVNSLAMHFGGQWFGWEELRSRANPDEKKYPEFTFALRVDLYRESSRFFKHLVQTNASTYDLLHSDYAFLNERLARHYGIQGITGGQLRKVTLTDPNRGGVLGMGSVLTASSLPLRSSPARRGAFVLGELLGTPPPDPPMNVAQLPEDDRELETRTFREALAQHREDAECRACHEMIDPIGFGLESFDAIGRWRTEQNGVPLDTAGTMPDGTRFASPAELKKSLLEKKELFARHFVEKLMAFAVGRELTPYDRPEIKKVTDALIADEGRIQTAILGVVNSYPFRYRGNDPTVAKNPASPSPANSKKPPPKRNGTKKKNSKK